MLPNFFVIGAGQAGTTSLHHYLSLHPEVHVSDPKEPNFFCRPEDGPYPFGRIDDRDQYEALFETDARVRGDCSPSYSQHPLRSEVPEQIAALVPDARLIYMVRDPIERILSHYVHEVSSIGERRHLERALDDLDGTRNPYVVGSSYATQLERYREVFGSERILVVDSDELRERRVEALTKVFGFLGVAADFRSPGFAEELDAGAAKRVHSARYAARDSRLGDAWRTLVSERLRAATTEHARRAAGRPVGRPKLEPRLRSRLETRLRPQAERLRELTGQPFAGWSL